MFIDILYSQLCVYQHPGKAGGILTVKINSNWFLQAGLNIQEVNNFRKLSTTCTAVNPLNQDNVFNIRNLVNICSQISQRCFL